MLKRNGPSRWIELVCPSVGASGEPIEPKLPAVREAMADDDAGGEHLNQIAKVIDKIPVESLEQADADLADAAQRFDPTALGQIGRKLVDVLDTEGMSRSILRSWKHRTSWTSVTIKTGPCRVGSPSVPRRLLICDRCCRR